MTKDETMSNNSTTLFYANQVIFSHNPTSAFLVSPIVIRVLGSNSAVIFAELVRRWLSSHYGWFAVSHRELSDELGLSLAVVRRCIHGHPNAPHKIPLTEIGVETKVCRRNGVPITHYRINENRLSEFFKDYADVIKEVNIENVRRSYGEKEAQKLRDSYND